MNRFQWVCLCTLVAVLVVVSSLEVWAQDEAEDLFGVGTAAGAAPVASSDSQPAPPERGERDFCRCLGEDPEATARITKALDAQLKSTGVEYTEAPLIEVTMDLSTTYGIPIQLDDTALEEIGLSSDEKVTVQLHNISLGSALRLILKRLNLTTVIRDEVLFITTEEEAERQLLTCVYDVRDFVDRPSGPKRESTLAQLQPLVDAITSCIVADSWKQNGGGGADVRPLSPGFLIISQTRAVQAEVAELLTSLRELRKMPLDAAGEPN